MKISGLLRLETFTKSRSEIFKYRLEPQCLGVSDGFHCSENNSEFHYALCADLLVPLSASEYWH